MELLLKQKHASYEDFSNIEGRNFLPPSINLTSSQHYLIYVVKVLRQGRRNDSGARGANRNKRAQTTKGEPI